jgi:hypothetical protein
MQLMSFSANSKKSHLTTADQAALMRLIEQRGDHALSVEIGVARQTLARAAAGLRVYGRTLETLRAYLAL